MSLYWRLLAWFLIANAVTAVVTVVVGTWLLRSTYTAAEARRDAEQAIEVYEARGSEGLQLWLSSKRRQEGVFGMLLDERGRPLVLDRLRLHPPGEGPLVFHLELPPPQLPRDGSLPEERLMLPPLPERPPQVGMAFAPAPGFVLRIGGLHQSVKLTSARGTTYRWEGARHPRPNPWMPYLDLLVRIGVGLCVIAAVALLAAQRLSRPIRALQSATRAFARGDFQARAPAEVTRRRDEFGGLATSFNELADALSRLFKTQRQLLRDVSHELRSPLARLTIAAELARETPKAAHFDRIQQEIGRLEELIGQVLTVARLEAHPTAPAREVVALDELLRGICADARLEADSRGVVIEAELAPDCTVTGTANLLRAALENVLRNAVRYTAPQTAVSVRLESAGAQARVQVCDRGPGVSQDRLDAIFEPFVRVSEARESNNGGYGLGLTIARDAVKLHGGSIRALPREGGGLCVEIELPRAAD